MKRAAVERNVAVFLFVLVLVVFSLAQRDTKKLFRQSNPQHTVDLEKKAPEYVAKRTIEQGTGNN